MAAWTNEARGQCVLRVFLGDVALRHEGFARYDVTDAGRLRLVPITRLQLVMAGEEAQARERADINEVVPLQIFDLQIVAKADLDQPAMMTHKPQHVDHAERRAFLKHRPGA